LLERGVPDFPFWIVRGQTLEHADKPHPFGLLRLRGQWPSGCCSTAKKSDELTPSHCPPEAQDKASCQLKLAHFKMPGVRSADVRFGSKADICNAKRHVRSTPESGHVRRNE
jgi:hypothetical protein